MRMSWLYRYLALLIYIIVATADIFVEDILTGFEAMLLFFIAMGINAICLAIEESKS